MAVTIEPLEARIAPAAVNLNPSSLDGTNGFGIGGELFSDYLGYSVSEAGDVNGDGFGDMIIGAHGAYGAGFNGPRSGAAYVVFGKASEFSASLNLSALDGSNGFKISGEAAGDSCGRSVSDAGDFNGDGFDDLIIGAYKAGPNGKQSGASYVVFGKASGFSATLNVASLDGSDGFKISGETAYGHSGCSVSAAGDVNGDGFGDVIIGGYATTAGGEPFAISYVVFGGAADFAANLDLSTLDETNGFKINGEAGENFSGRAVSGAGDVNGDGFDDLIIGASQADPNGDGSGATFVVFGKAACTNLDLSMLDGSNGFKISGENPYDYSGFSVSAAGDVNGDGFDDVIIGAFLASGSGVAYVVFGKQDGFAANLNLSVIDGANGFKIGGEQVDDHAGIAVSDAGDVNGDGFGDLLIGAAGKVNVDYDYGVCYLVYGRPSGFGENLDLTTLDGRNGFRIHTGVTYEGFGLSVGGAGDINGDGLDDFIIGAPFTSSGVDFTHYGAAYVVFGSVERVAISHDGKTATFTDSDGDLVKARVSTGKLAVEDFHFAADGSLRSIDLRDLANEGTKPVNLAITAKTPKHGMGDGLVNVGAIDATDIDLGIVIVDGNLLKIVAGDIDFTTPGVKALTVGGLGKLHIASPGEEYHSIIAGKLGKLTVRHDVTSAELEVIGGADGDIGAVKIGGSLRGDMAEDSGSIYAQGDIGAVKIGGDIVGGDGDFSGRIATGAALVSGSIKSIVLGGSLVGGAGRQSGGIGSDTTIGAIKIGGSIDGGIINVAGRTSPVNAKAARALGSLIVNGNVSDAFIGIGYRSNGEAINADVQLGSVFVKGTWSSSSLAVGIDDATSDGFGQNDTLIAGGSDAIVATIASITIKGAAIGTAVGGDFFGITAERIKKARVHGSPVGLTGNEDDVLLDSTSNDFRLFEV